MTPKEQYEARKAERAKLKELDYQVRSKTETIMLLDIVDRFATAAERIADAEVSNVVHFSEKSAERYIQQAIAAFMRDPPDTDFQRGYLEALLVVQREAFSPQSRLPCPEAS